MFLASFPSIKPTLFIILAGLLSACASLNSSHEAPQESDQAVVQASPLSIDLNNSLQVSEVKLPNLELDADLLEQLLITNLASYSGNWMVATENAMAAAEASHDYRIARLAALLALRAENYTEAIKGALLWQELTPDNADAHTTLLLAQLEAGQVDAALQSFDKRRFAKKVDQHIREVAGLLIRQHNTESAISIAQFYLDTYPNSAQVALSAAYVAERFKKEDLVEKWLQQALKLRPNWDLAAQMRIAELRRLGNNEEAERYIEQYLTANPSSIFMRINHAAVLAKREKYQDALTLMQQVLRDDPNNSGALDYSAALAQQLDQMELAKGYYQRALSLDASNDDIRWALARIAVQEKEYRRAESHYQQIHGEQNYFRAQLQVANMRYYTQGLKSAMDTLRALEPSTEAEYVDRATTRHYLLLQDYQYEEAFGAINETLAYLPENLELIYARALVAAELNELQTVESDLRAIIAVQPNHANALNALGYTLADQTERYDEAKELIIKALELRPNDAHILDSMGWVLYRLSDLEQSIGFLQRAYAQAPEVEVAAHLGEVLWEKGEPDKARLIWSEAYDKESNNPLLNRTLERYGVNLVAP